MYEPLEPRRLRAVDLTVSDTAPFTDHFTVGQFLPVAGTFHVSNLGTAATSGPVAYQIVAASDYALTKDVTVIGEASTSGAIAAGATDVAVPYQFAAPTALAGQFRYYGVVLDPHNAIPESDETNNSKGDANGLLFASTLVGDGVAGTAGDDVIGVDQQDGVVIITHSDHRGADSDAQMVRVADLTTLTVDLGAGNDRLSTFGEAFPTVPLVVHGGAGNDTINGGHANDTLFGDEGDDVMIGMLGVDLVDGGAGNDKLYCYGNASGTTLIGGAGDDTLNGAAGNDSLDGGDGNDYLLGNAGNDTIAGGGGRDAIYGGDGDDRMSGNAQGDYLSGGAGNDTLSGNGGNDRLNGGTGADRLIGGLGADILSVALAEDGVDTLSGNGGNDAAIAPASAILSSIERHPAA